MNKKIKTYTIKIIESIIGASVVSIATSLLAGYYEISFMSIKFFIILLLLGYIGKQIILCLNDYLDRRRGRDRIKIDKDENNVSTRLGFFPIYLIGFPVGAFMISFFIYNLIDTSLTENMLFFCGTFIALIIMLTFSMEIIGYMTIFFAETWILSMGISIFVEYEVLHEIGVESQFIETLLSGKGNIIVSAFFSLLFVLAMIYGKDEN